MLKKLSLITAIALLTACQSTPPKPAPLYVPNIALQPAKVLEILPNRSVCDSSSPMQCLLVKVDGTSDSEIFGIGFNDIKGFEPKIGVRYKIRASQEIDQNTGKPTGYWQLDEILSQHISR